MTARAAGAAATAASHHAFDAILAGLADKPQAVKMIADAARAEAARHELRGRGMFFAINAILAHKPPRELRERGLTDAEMCGIYATVPEGEVAASVANWASADIEERDRLMSARPADDAAPESAPAREAATGAAAPQIIINNHITAPAPSPAPATSPSSLPVIQRAPSPPLPPLAAPFEHPAATPPEPAAQPPQPAAPARTKKTATAETPADDAPRVLISDFITVVNASDQKRNKINEESARDFARGINLFAEIAGIQFLDEITQERLSDFVDAQELIPTHYRKSEAERFKPIWDIINDAEEAGLETGLSPATINKNITHLNKLIKHARAKGHALGGHLETSLLRITDKEAKRDKRAAFTLEDVRKIFAEKEYDPAGGCDALFWIAHIAAYTGARREEIAGLDAADIVERDGVPFFHIRDNDNRTLKNGQSNRFIPLHRDLIALDLPSLARERKGKMLFNIRRKSRISTLGDSISYRWKSSLERALAGETRRKSFHSFRHYAVQQMKDANIGLDIRGAIFGHLTGNIEDDVYGGDGATARLLHAINTLPGVRE